MKQPDLFGEPGLEPAVQQIARQEREQEKQIRRAAMKLRPAIEAFMRERASAANPLFSASELHDFVALHAAAAPSSADRVLRLLRQAGVVNYVLLDRARSLYSALEVG